MRDGVSLRADFAATWRHVARLCREQPENRVILTRHGDAMLLSQFLLTRVVEVAVHGIDLAHALERRPWLTEPAADLVSALLLGPQDGSMLNEICWSSSDFVIRATGREPIDGTDTDRLERLGISWLTLG